MNLYEGIKNALNENYRDNRPGFTYKGKHYHWHSRDMVYYWDEADDDYFQEVPKGAILDTDKVKKECNNNSKMTECSMYPELKEADAKSAKYNVVEVTDTNSAEVFEKLYDGSAMTVQGMKMGELQQYIDFFTETCGLHNNCTVYHFVGGTYNNYYNLTGSNRYPDDLNCISISLDDMDNCMGARQMIRWFDDIVDNDLRREGR